MNDEKIAEHLMAFQEDFLELCKKYNVDFSICMVAQHIKSEEDTHGIAVKQTVFMDNLVKNKSKIYRLPLIMAIAETCGSFVEKAKELLKDIGAVEITGKGGGKKSQGKQTKEPTGSISEVINQIYNEVDRAE